MAEAKKEITKKEDKKEQPKAAKETAKPVAKKAGLPELRPGYKVRVHQRIKEGKKERVQIFEGMIIAFKGQDKNTRTMTVRKMSGNVAVEKIFPLVLPTIEKVEVVGAIKTRRSKLYYLRDYNKKLKDQKV